ncbi:hypothetical protein B0H14DRAFT_3168344 [Mycena olivaceomarginata]|nr:hypothetical protein B0H14DRAFT_3168344 [Mycena olivaceomarginata]
MNVARWRGKSGQGAEAAAGGQKGHCGPMVAKCRQVRGDAWGKRDGGGDAKWMRGSRGGIGMSRRGGGSGQRVQSRDGDEGEIRCSFGEGYPAYIEVKASMGAGERCGRGVGVGGTGADTKAGAGLRGREVLGSAWERAPQQSGHGAERLPGWHWHAEQGAVARWLQVCDVGGGGRAGRGRGHWEVGRSTLAVDAGRGAGGVWEMGENGKRERRQRGDGTGRACRGENQRRPAWGGTARDRRCTERAQQWRRQDRALAESRQGEAVQNKCGVTDVGGGAGAGDTGVATDGRKAQGRVRAEGTQRRWRKGRAYPARDVDAVARRNGTGMGADTGRGWKVQVSGSVGEGGGRVRRGRGGGGGGSPEGSAARELCRGGRGAGGRSGQGVMLVHSPLIRGQVGQELNRRHGGGVFVGIESVHAALNEFECCRSLRDGFFFAIEFFHCGNLAEEIERREPRPEGLRMLRFDHSRAVKSEAETNWGIGVAAKNCGVDQLLKAVYLSLTLTHEGNNSPFVGLPTLTAEDHLFDRNGFAAVAAEFRRLRIVPHALENLERTSSLSNERRGDIKGMDLDGEFAQDLELVK